MIIVYILRAFGGVLAVQMLAPIPPSVQPPNVTFYVRSGSATITVRGA